VDYDNDANSIACWLCDRQKYVVIFYDVVGMREEVIEDEKLAETFR